MPKDFHIFVCIYFSSGWHPAVIHVQPKQSVLCRNSRAWRVRHFCHHNKKKTLIIFQCFAYLILNCKILITIFKLNNRRYVVYCDCRSSSLCSDEFVRSVIFLESMRDEETTCVKSCCKDLKTGDSWEVKSGISKNHLWIKQWLYYSH